MRCGLLSAAMMTAASTAAVAERDIDFQTSIDAADAAIIAMRDEKQLNEISTVIGPEAGARLAAAIRQSGFEAKDEAAASFVTGADGLGELHVVSVKREGMRGRDWADFGGRVATLALKSKAKRIAVVAPGANAEALSRAALGAELGQYRFLKYRPSARTRAGDLVFISADAAAAERRHESVERPAAEAANWARDLQSEPANILYPEEFVRRTRAAFDGVDHVSIEALDVSAMEKLGMGALLGVGRGSVRPPRLLVVRYRGGEKDAPIAFVGKGITFDSGGVSLKDNDGMWKMKSDMTGAAVSVAATLALAKSKAPVNVVAVAALAENMPDGGAIRPGDVLKTMSGKTIEVRSTDAEGRLVLSDAIWYVQEKDRPRLLVDVATLTGSVGRALGDEYAGLFARDDAVAARLLKAGEIAGEDLWRLPLHPNHFDQIKSDIADVKNGDAGDPGASIGAAFIATFVKKETAWAHLDIAGVDWRDDSTPTSPKGASGFGVRLLVELARGPE